MSANPEPPLNPFPGLRPFRSDEHHLFFGRENQTAALLQLLRDPTAVSKPSATPGTTTIRVCPHPEIST
jgi:hypothetical protein